MDNQKMSLLFNAKLQSFEKLNDQFLKCKCYVLALGKNRNKSHFSKDNVDKAYSTLSFVPVVGHLMCDENGTHYLGGHDVTLDLSTLSLKSVCVPFGVAIPSPEPTYEDVVESDGAVATYLTSDVVLWIGRYPELAEAVYSEDTYFGQSMEVLFSKAEPLKDDPTYKDIIDFSFDALCLLGKSDDPRFNTTPCFPSASVKPITYSIDKDEFSCLMAEMKEQLSFCLNNTETTNQGGNTLNEKDTILQKYGKTVEDLDFSIEELSLEEFEAKMDELFGEKETEPTEPEAEPVAEPEVEAVVFSATYNQKRDALRSVFSPVIVKDEGGNYVEETYYYVCDFDDEYVYVEVDHYTADNYDCKYGRQKYVFDDATTTATLDGDFEEMVRVWMTLAEKEKLDADRNNYETVTAEFEAYKADHAYENAQFEALNEFKAAKEAEERKANEIAIFNKFEKAIGGTVEFSELKEKASQFSIEDLRKECLCIVGLYATSNTDENEKPAETTIKFSVEPTQDSEDEPYGGLMKKYLNK